MITKPNWLITLTRVSAFSSTVLNGRFGARLCENHFVRYLRARLIQTACRTRIKDTPRLRLRFCCCVLTMGPNVFTQPRALTCPVVEKGDRLCNDNCAVRSYCLTRECSRAIEHLPHQICSRCLIALRPSP